MRVDWRRFEINPRIAANAFSKLTGRGRKNNNRGLSSAGANSMADNESDVDRRLSRRSLLFGALTLPLVVVDPEPASAQLGLIGAILGGMRFRGRRRHYGGYSSHYHARSHYAHRRGRAHVASSHRRHGGGGGGGGSGGGGGGGIGHVD